MDRKNFAEPSPFAQSGQPANESANNVKRDTSSPLSSLSSMASQAVHTEDHQRQQRGLKDDVNDSILAPNFTMSQSSQPLYSENSRSLPLEKRSGWSAINNSPLQTIVSTSSASNLPSSLNAPAGQDKKAATTGATGTRSSGVMDEANAPTLDEAGGGEKTSAQKIASMDATQSSNDLKSREGRAHTEPQKMQPINDQSDRAKSVPSVSATAKIQSTIIRLPSINSPARDFGPSEENEANLTLEAQTHDGTPARSPGVPEEPQEPQPQTTGKKRRRSAFEMLQAEADKHLGSDYNKQDKRRASAPGSAPVLKKTTVKKSGSGSLVPAQMSTATPGRRGRPRKSETSGVAASATKQHKVTKTPVQRKSARTTGTMEGPRSSRISSIKKLQHGNGETSKVEATPVSARRGRPPKTSIAKLVELAETTDTPKRRGRPPKNATTPLSAKPVTPASQNKVSRRKSAPAAEFSQASITGFSSILRSLPSPKASARISKQVEEAANPGTPASVVKRRGRPPKNANTVVTDSPAPVEPRGMPQSGLRGRRPLNTTDAMSGLEPHAETKSTTRIDREANEAPVKRRGRRPKSQVAQETASQPTEEPNTVPKKRGRQPKSAPADKPTSQSTANETSPAPIKRRGRPPKSSGTANSVPESAAKKVGAVLAKRQGRSAKPVAEEQPIAESAEKLAPKKRGRQARAAAVDEQRAREINSVPEKKRGRPSKSTEKSPISIEPSKKRGRPSKNETHTSEEPKAKKRRTGDSNGDADNTNKKGTEGSVLGNAPAGRQGRATKTAPVQLSETASRGRGRKAAVAESSSSTGDMQPSPRLPGRPGRKVKTLAVESVETKTEAKPKGRRGRPAATKGVVAKTGRPQGIVRAKPPAKKAGGGGGANNLRRSARSKA